MILDFHETDEGGEGHARWDLLGADIELLVNGRGGRAAAEVGVAAVDEIPEGVFATLLGAAARYRTALAPGAGGLLEVSLDDIEPVALVVWPEGEGVAISLEFTCQWEGEHGMEWYLVDGQPRYVGPAVGENPREEEFFPNYLHGTPWRLPPQ
ncbi:MAG: hypothetical protein LWW77_09880 [Propionibacteriales bacterium]|nr:hypothetical protein [Propionibacteriales bacterium]